MCVPGEVITDAVHLRRRPRGNDRPSRRRLAFRAAGAGGFAKTNHRGIQTLQAPLTGLWQGAISPGGTAPMGTALTGIAEYLGAEFSGTRAARQAC